jgi:hypothetical protein
MLEVYHYIRPSATPTPRPVATLGLPLLLGPMLLLGLLKLLSLLTH